MSARLASHASGCLMTTLVAIDPRELQASTAISVCETMIDGTT